jgi:hypothetical protein
MKLHAKNVTCFNQQDIVTQLTIIATAIKAKLDEAKNEKPADDCKYVCLCAPCAVCGKIFSCLLTHYRDSSSMDSSGKID